MADPLHDPGRRRVIQQLAAGAGGLLALPFVADAHPVQHYLHDAAAVGLADANAQAPDYKPQFLSAHQLETLRLLCERIIPGSAKAKSAEFIDQLLTVAAVDEQREFLEAMGAFEQLAMTRASGPWKQLTDDQQHALLTHASTEKAGTPTPRVVTIRDHFENLKGWTVGAYYSSEIGMRELGWTGVMMFSEFPGCPHTEGHGA